MFKSKLANNFDCTLIAVFFLCAMKAYSTQENASVNMSAMEHKSQEYEYKLNSTEKMDYYSSVVTNISRTASLNINEPEIDVHIEHNDQIESNNFTPISDYISYNQRNNNSLISYNNYKTDNFSNLTFLNELNENFSFEQNTSLNNKLTVDNKLLYKEPSSLPNIRSGISSDFTNNNSINENSKDSNSLYILEPIKLTKNPEIAIETAEAFPKIVIKQTFNDSTLKTNTNEIESQMTNVFTEQTEDSNVDLIITETTKITTETTIEHLTEMIRSMVNNFNMKAMSPTSENCNVSIEIVPHIIGDNVIVGLKPENINTSNLKICLYLSNSTCNSTDSIPEPCEDSSSNYTRCSNFTNKKCQLQNNKDSHYIIGWYGCKDNNYTNCTFSPINSHHSGSDNKVIIIILATVIPLVICVAFFIAIFYTKKKKTCLGVKKLKQIPLSRSSSRKRIDKMINDANSTEINMDETQSKVIPKSKPILLSNFNEYYLLKRADSSLKLAEEFEELRTLSKKESAKLSQISINKPKNRFVNILPYDHSIVPLKLKNGELGSDYINANFISGHNFEKEFIACQGPLRSTVNDFFRMIIEQNVRIIVMLTQCIEKGRQKCEKYWPSSDDLEDSKDSKTPTLLFDDIAVELSDERTENDFIIRDLKLVKDNSIHSVTQFHFSQWPDFGCPQNPLSLIHLIEVIRKHSKTISDEDCTEETNPKPPIVVHCSAGVGRSGTFICVDRIWQKLSQIGLNSDQSSQSDIFIDIFGTVYDMRKNRPNMVQTEDQYIYIYECVSHLIDKIKKENSNNDSEDSRIKTEDIKDDKNQEEEDKKSSTNNNYILDESKNEAFSNQEINSEEVSEFTEL